jgi:predicted exporter
MLLLVLLGCGYRLFATQAAAHSDRRATVTTSLLIVALSALTLIEPTLPQPPATPSQPS